MKMTYGSFLCRAGMTALSSTLLSLPMYAAGIHAQSNEVVVTPSKDLPAEARAAGCSLFLSSTSDGSEYLYVEQAEGKRLVTFNVSDPGRIRLVASTELAAPAAFDFVQALDANNEVVRFRDGKGMGVLHLHKGQGSLTVVSTEDAAQMIVVKGDVLVNIPTGAPKDYKIVAPALSGESMNITTVHQVAAKAFNSATGTTYLVGSEGLTVIRQRTTEEANRQSALLMAQN